MGVLYLQVVKAQMEADDMAAKLEKCSKENKTLKDDMSKEIELVTVSLKPDMKIFVDPPVSL